MKAIGSIGAAFAALILVGATNATIVDAHKAQTSPYTYNADIRPLLQEHCGRCHADGGPTPMSLMTYDADGGAVAWAESIREMLLAGAMPPWYADPAGRAVRSNHNLPARDLDKIITWATGGTPQGDRSKALPSFAARQGWMRGEPDAELAMLRPFVLGADTIQATADVSITTDFGEDKWVKAVDLQPGEASMVRRAFISIKNGPLLAVWEPGDDPVEPPSEAAFRLPAGAVLRLKVDYKKSWRDEGRSLEDRSVVGLYFTSAPPSQRSVESLSIDAPTTHDPAIRSFSGVLKQGGRIVGLRPMLDVPYTLVEVTALLPAERVVPLLTLRRARPEWPRRYWLVEPIDLPANTRIDVRLIPSDADETGVGRGDVFPLQLGLDVVPR